MKIGFLLIFFLANRRMASGRSLFVVLAVCVAGCSSGPSTVHPADVDPAGAGEAAVDEYDADGDGAISGEELDAVPGIRDSLEMIDLDGDRRVTAEEIAARIQSWQDARVGMTEKIVTVKLDGKLLDGATVVFEPEEFLGGEVLPGEGVSDATGMAYISVAEEHRPRPEILAMHLGYFKVRVTKDGKIPARYNTNTILGDEIGNDEEHELVLGLKSDKKSKN